MITFRRLSVAASLSVAALAAGTGAVPFAATLGVGPMSARAATPVPEAIPDQVVVRVAPGTSDADVQRIAAGAGCTVGSSVKYMPGFYVFKINGVSPAAGTSLNSGTGGAASRSLTSRTRPGRATTSTAYGPPTAQVQSIVTALKKINGVLAADPCYVRRKDDYNAVTPLPGGFLLPAAVTALPAKSATRAVTSFTRFTANPAAAKFTPNDTYYTQGLQADMDVIRMPEAWQVQKGTKQVLVGVADTGIYAAHPDFVRVDGTAQVVAEADFTGTNGTGNDGHGHGTHCSGTVAAVTNNGIGVASVAGLATNGVDVRLVGAKVLADAGFGLDPWIASGIEYLIQKKVGVISLSLGGLGDSAVQRQAIQDALNAGIIVVAAAGNDAVDNLVFPHYPAEYPGVIEVASVGNDKNIAFYSNFGGNVTISAPGGNNPGFVEPGLILSTWPGNDNAYFEGYPMPLEGGLYQAIQGTSQATPHVSGAAALLLAQGVPASQVPNTLIVTSQLPAGTYDPNVYGAGVLDVYSALMFNNPSGQVIVQFADPTTLTTTYARKTTVPIRLLVTDPTFDASQLTLDVRAATTSDTIGGGTNPNDTGPLLRSFSGNDLPTIPVQTPGASVAYQNFSFPGAGQPDLVLSGALTDKYKLVLKYKGTVVATKFVQVLTVTEKKGLTMFSVPFQVRAANPTNAEQATLGTSSFLLVRYNPLASGYAYFSPGALPTGLTNSPVASFAGRGSSDPLYVTDASTGADVAPVGLGYWLRTDSDVALNVSGDSVTDPVAIKLFATGSQGQATSGWNMIGAPFPYAVPWSSVIVRVPVFSGTKDYTLQQALDNGVLGNTLVGWNGVDYSYSVSPSGSLDPFSAYWVQTNQDCTLIVPALSPATRSAALAVASRTGAATSRSVAPAATAGGWRVRLAATVAGETDGQNYFGQAPGASDSTDRLDIAKPPAAGHAYVRFLQSAGSGAATRSLAYDLHALSGSGSVKGQQWTVAVSSDRTDADVTLSWDGLGGAPRRSRLVLKDTATGQTIPMASRSSYTFRAAQAGSTRQFTITLEQQASAGPLAIRNLTVSSLGRAAAAGGAGSLAIRFMVSQDADVVAAVRTIGGKLLATVGGAEGTGRAVAAAQTTLHWDGRAADGAPLPAGTYMLEVTARGTDGQVAVLKRPVLIAR